MPEEAKKRCPSCGVLLHDNEPCFTPTCKTNRDTLRPRNSQTHSLRDSRPSGQFEVRESKRSTYRNLGSHRDPDSEDSASESFPNEPRVPDFPDPVSRES